MHNIPTQLCLPITFHICRMGHCALLNFILNYDLTSRSSCVFWCILISTCGIMRYYLKPTNRTFLNLLTKHFAHLVSFCGLRMWVLGCSMLLTWLFALWLNPAGSSETKRNRDGDRRFCCLCWLNFDVRLGQFERKNKPLVGFCKGPSPLTRQPQVIYQESFLHLFWLKP